MKISGAIITSKSGVATVIWDGHTANLVCDRSLMFPSGEPTVENLLAVRAAHRAVAECITQLIDVLEFSEADAEFSWSPEGGCGQ